MTVTRRSTLLFCGIFAVTLALRLCHSHVLWVDEDYHMAAGIQALHGKLLYRDLWYDKPPLAAWLYAAMGGFAGFPLRLFGALYVLAICGAVWRFARALWSDREALLAAALMAFFLNFDFAPAILPAAPDLLMMLPTILAVYCAWRGKALSAGMWSAIAFLFHTKGLFALAMCAVLCWRSLPRLALGFAIPNGVVFGVLAAGGALRGYWRQVWEWGMAYTRGYPDAKPLVNGLRRVVDWAGFHAALVIGAAIFWWHRRSRTTKNDAPDWRLTAWVLISFAGAALGWRFSPRYLLELLPPLVIISARAFAVAAAGLRRRTSSIAFAAVVAMAVLVPLVRFGPRYFNLAGWSDLTLDRDSQSVAAILNARQHPGDTLVVWGYRPDIFVYTRLAAGSRYWDSQPLTGVPADRHLFSALPVIPEWAARNRAEFTASHPTFLVDSLSRSNPRLAIDTYPELRAWLSQYHVSASTPLTVIYQWGKAQ
jgi:4-amino-4-deoxy-L-arabinose transferase-like glycosyltransferase